MEVGLFLEHLFVSYMTETFVCIIAVEKGSIGPGSGFHVLRAKGDGS